MAGSAVVVIGFEMAVDQAPILDERSYIEGYDTSPDAGIPSGNSREDTEALCDDYLGKDLDPGMNRHDWIAGCADAALGAPQQVR